MIQWTIQGTVPQLTGVTVFEGSSSSSSTLFRTTTETDASATSIGFLSNTSTFFHQTSSGLSGRTTFHSSSNSVTEFGSTSLTNDFVFIDSNGVEQTGDSFTDSFGSSSSLSGSSETTGEFTQQAQTSTTESLEVQYQVTASITEGGPFGTIWTTSSNTFGSIAFFQTLGTETSSLGVSFATSAETVDAVTFLDEIITVTAIPDTVIQADTRRADLAEVIYKLTKTINAIDGLSAATTAADSATRITVSPSVVTADKTPANVTRPTSSIELVEETALFVITNSKTTSVLATLANYASFPPVTATITRAGLTTEQSTLGTNIFSSQIDETHGGTTSTVTARDFATYSSMVTRQVGTLTFHATVPSVSTFTITTTIEAAGTESFSESTVMPFSDNTSQNATFRSSGITANTFLPTVRADVGAGGGAQQIKYGTSGAEIEGEVAGFITANVTLGAVFFTDLYAFDGGHRLATTVFPQTNLSRTIDGDSITFSTTTNGVLSIDGATSKKTFATGEIGVDGSTQTVTLSRPISNFDGSAGLGETFVQTAQPGVYKNRIDGATISFDGAASIVSAGQAQALAMWQPIKDFRNLASSTNFNPVTWSEFRNSSALPPAMPPSL